MEFKPNKNKHKIEKEVTSIRIDSNLLEKIDQLSLEADISRNEFIVQCIEYALQNMKQD